MIKKIYEKIKEFNKIIIHRHTRPDGDALGAQIGLKESIKETFPDKQVFAVGDENDRYRFIGEVDDVNDNIYEDALVIVLDTAETELISDNRYHTGKFLIKMDHHLEVRGYGDLKLVDTSFESCAGLITYFIKLNNMKLNSIGARALYSGIVTDSGRFRYSSTSARTFEMASYLLGYNFDVDDVYQNLYIEDLTTVKLRAQMVSKFKITNHNVAYLVNTKEDVIASGLDVFSFSRGMVNVMAGIKGINIWVNFTEDPTTEKVLVEIRSNGININKIAVKYGGGGHLNASGATIDSFEVADKLLKDLDKLMIGEENVTKNI
jgi:phosphoesterase RecJ-like protein